jgi:signal transduction histidine kinase
MTRADAARRDAEEANQTKDQFLAVLDTNCETPLARALTALELMKARDPEGLQTRTRGPRATGRHMSRLVNGWLDVSRLARGKVQLDRRRFELREAVDRAVDMTRPAIAQHRHTLDVSVPAVGLTIDGDVDRIVQVLCNLLTNAAKYTPPGGHIALVAQETDDELALQLRAIHSDIRLIALTGYGPSADLDAATAAGFDAHCAKPVTIAALLDQIEGRKAV